MEGGAGTLAVDAEKASNCGCDALDPTFGKRREQQRPSER
jgi:hypothetical protein